LRENHFFHKYLLAMKTRNFLAVMPLLVFFLVLFFMLSCNQAPPMLQAQQSGALVGGGCDGCELMYIGMPPVIKAVDTSAGWREQGRKLLLTGKVYRIDGKTPAANVILYYWHTDNNGYYSPQSGITTRATRHGHLRGWIKTDAQGNYALYTIRPKAYPDLSEPEHIHFSIKEPDIANEYYIDDIVFDDDPLLLASLKRRPPQKRGGSGIVRIVLSENLQIAEHSIILGLNIPNYPLPKNAKTAHENSGLSIGEDSPSFLPFHAWGADA
jgi:protocatechuate 3,4-dioxygenase, beta subunit